MSTGDLVTFETEGEQLAGTVTRVWAKPAADPYVTIVTDEFLPRTFVRTTSAVTRTAS